MKISLKQELTKQWFKNLQDIICKNIEEIENKKIIFVSKKWKRNKKKNEGGGESKLLENGKVFEKVGVNFSEVYGKFPDGLKGKLPDAKNNTKFWASGISIVMHMKNPNVPAMHFNTRYINTSFGWFGGGMDVTPCFKDENLKNGTIKILKKCVIGIIRDTTKNTVIGVINIFIYRIVKRQGVLGEYSLILKKIIGKKIFIL